MYQLSGVICTYFLLILVSTQAASIKNCTTDNYECYTNVQCCSKCCLEGVCVPDTDQCRDNNLVITKRSPQMTRRTCADINPPCPPSSKCVLHQVQCFVAPCYPIPMCIDESGKWIFDW
ncbi:uncharacterized protein LOC111644093 [Copidosoma floridanum]|uniref:uncharacterized protein LOC111644093 n=1 Tax=Copidosoma floridanum TaxID=29053 RepID=UPI000C6F4800|nr:uncharacterized protein LOC111644093 [Copidosoma floridanum]